MQIAASSFIFQSHQILILVRNVFHIGAYIFLFDSYCKSIDQKYVSIIAEHYENTQRFPERYYENKIGYWRSLCSDYTPVWMQMDLLKGLKTHPHHYANGLNGGHPSKEGHKTIANKIIELIDAI